MQEALNQALSSAESVPRVDVFEVSSAKAGVIAQEAALYPTIK